MGSFLKVNHCAEMNTSYFGPQNQQERAWLCNLGGKTSLEGGEVLDRSLGHPLNNLQCHVMFLFIYTCCILYKAAFSQFPIALFFKKVDLVLTHKMENSILRTMRGACTQCSLFSRKATTLGIFILSTTGLFLKS